MPNVLVCVITATVVAVVSITIPSHLQLNGWFHYLFWWSRTFAQPWCYGFGCTIQLKDFQTCSATHARTSHIVLEVAYARFCHTGESHHKLGRCKRRSTPTPTVIIATPMTPDKGDWSEVHSIHSFSHLMQITWVRDWTSIQALDWLVGLSQHESMLFPVVGGK